MMSTFRSRGNSKPLVQIISKYFIPDGNQQLDAFNFSIKNKGGYTYFPVSAKLEGIWKCSQIGLQTVLEASGKFSLVNGADVWQWNSSRRFLVNVIRKLEDVWLQ
jgi:hypothetical protein